MIHNGERSLVKVGTTSLAKRMDPLEEYITPAADIFETSKSFIVKIDVPGVPKESISVNVLPGKLQVKGLMHRLHRENANVLLSEMQNMSYYREFNLGGGVDTERIEAYHEDGVLTIFLHKNESMIAREIPIK
jgi:HSP20 family protein